MKANPELLLIWAGLLILILISGIVNLGPVS